MASWFEHKCGNGCGQELPDVGFKRRRVPGKRGLRDVCEPCAALIDRQGTFDVGKLRPFAGGKDAA